MQTVGVRPLSLGVFFLLLSGCFDGSDDGDGFADNSGIFLQFTNPGEVELIQTPDITVNIVGTASSDTEIEKVEWINDRGGRGFANGKEKWVTGNIVLQLGMNKITITATDADGDKTEKSLTVEREAKGTPAAEQKDPVAMYSYRADLGSAAPVEGATIDPHLVYFFMEPGSDWSKRGVEEIAYVCCKGISGPGEGDGFDARVVAGSAPWIAAIDLSGYAPGGVRRLRTATSFSNNSDPSAPVFDFILAGSAEPPNAPPTISGTPPSGATVGLLYSFTPTARDSDGDSLSFSITNLPGWADFDPTTGHVSGKPTVNDTGIFSNIQISVSDGRASANLAAFAIVVQATGSGSATLTWNPPMFRVDGSPLNDLAGYEIRFGNASRSYSNRITLNNPGLASHAVDGLGAGTWYFAVLAFDSSGQLSAPSAEAQKTIR